MKTTSTLSVLSHEYPFLGEVTRQRPSGGSDPLKFAEVYGGRGVSAALSSCADGIWEGSQPRDQSIWGSERKLWKLLMQAVHPSAGQPNPYSFLEPRFLPPIFGERWLVFPGDVSKIPIPICSTSL